MFVDQVAYEMPARILATESRSLGQRDPPASHGNHVHRARVSTERKQKRWGGNLS